ncbi:MAG: hypothetical protein ACJ8F7_10965 [Gemmataceae bacterium]
MLTCPMCKKALAPATTPCPRCRADLTLLVDYMDHLDEQLQRAEEALKAGELGDAVWAYMNVLETDPDHATARRQVSKVVTAVRQFDEAKRTGYRTMFVLGAVAVVLVILLAGAVFVGGYKVGVWRATPKTDSANHVTDDSGKAQTAP